VTLAVRTHGIILFTRRYADCRAFYRDTLGLPVWFEKPGLTCLRFGDGYLMVEDGAGRRLQPGPTTLRFNVDDVAASAQALREIGVPVEVQRFDWGTVAGFSDPDGNACELKDAADPFFAGRA
jgi:lactoylglutathione lyase